MWYISGVASIFSWETGIKSRLWKPNPRTDVAHFNDSCEHLFDLFIIVFWKTWRYLTLQTSSSWELISKHRCRELPSSSSNKTYLPPKREALWPSRGWPGREEGGPWARQREGHRGGDKVRGGITVLWIETSCKGCGTGMLGTTPCGTLGFWEGASSRGLTREMDCMEFSGEREVSVVVLANIMLWQCLRSVD